MTGYETVEEPPEGQRKRVPWDDIAAQAKASPGRWVVVPDVNRGYGSQIKKGQLAPFRDGRWETARRKLGGESKGNVTLYVRYEGE